MEHVVELVEKVKKIIEEQEKVGNPEPSNFGESAESALLGSARNNNRTAIVIAPKAIPLILEFSSIITTNFEKYKSITTHISDGEWILKLQSFFGFALAQNICVDLTLDEKATKIYEEVINKIDEISSDYKSNKYYFGCDLFAGLKINPIFLGPVIFENRLSWLERKFKNSEISEFVYSHFNKLWAKATADNNERTYENQKKCMEVIKNINDIVGNSEFVCSVTTKTIGRMSGGKKALLAARLALTAIAISIRPASMALDGIKIINDGSAVTIKALVKFENEEFLVHHVYSSRALRGVPITNIQYEDDFMSDFLNYSLTVQEILHHVLGETDKKSERSNEIKNLTYSLLWFYKGCREDINLISIVNFATVLETLSDNKETSGAESIKQEIEKSFSVSRESNVPGTGMTICDAIDIIYSTIRNKTIHGEGKKGQINHDWGMIRGIAELLSSDLLMHKLTMEQRNHEKSMG